MPAGARAVAGPVVCSFAALVVGAGCAADPEDGPAPLAAATTTTIGASTTTVPAVDACALVTDADLAALGLADVFPGPGRPTVPPLAPEELAEPWSACDRSAGEGAATFLRVEVAGGASATFERAVAEVSTTAEPVPVDGVGDQAAGGVRPGWYPDGADARSLVVLVGGRVVRVTVPDDGVDDVVVELGRIAARRVGGAG